MMMVFFDQSVATPCLAAAKETSCLWSAWFPGLAGVMVGFSSSELASYLKRRSERKREYRKFLADQANRLMEDIVRVFFGAKNELGYLASELSQIDVSIAEAKRVMSLYTGATGVVPGASELEQHRKARDKYLEDAYANLKKYHAQGEPSVRLLCSMPIKIDLSFLEEFLSEVTRTYQLDTKGVINQCHIYESLHKTVLDTRESVLNELLSSIRK
jgi:hypothetical protein